MNARAHELPSGVTERPRPEVSGASAEGRTGAGKLAGANIRIAGRRTSLRLEPEMWSALHEVAELEGRTIHDICTAVAALPRPGDASLTSSIRVFLLQYFRALAMQNRPRGRVAPPLIRHGPHSRSADLV